MGHEPAEGARVEATAPGGDEDGVLGSGHELRPPVADVETEPVGGLFAERDHTLLSALAADVDGLGVEIDVCEIEVDSLLAAESGRVDELDESAIAQLQRLVACEAGQRAVNLGDLRRLGEPVR